MERLQLKEEVVKDRQREIPPYTGFGSEEDSLTSSQGLEPRAPQADFFKFMHKDRYWWNISETTIEKNEKYLILRFSKCNINKRVKHTFFLYRDGFDGHILRFSARLLVNDKPDTQRKFVIAYFLSDDTVLVSQEREQNSGMLILPVF